MAKQTVRELVAALPAAVRLPVLESYLLVRQYSAALALEDWIRWAVVDGQLHYEPPLETLSRVVDQLQVPDAQVECLEIYQTVTEFLQEDPDARLAECFELLLSQAQAAAPEAPAAAAAEPKKRKTKKADGEKATRGRAKPAETVAETSPPVPAVRIPVTAQQVSQVAGWLQAAAPVPGQDINTVLLEFSHPMGELLARVAVTNGEDGVWIDAHLLKCGAQPEDDEIVWEFPSGVTQLAGVYDFTEAATALPAYKDVLAPIEIAVKATR